MTEEKRKQLNAERLTLVDISIRQKVASCLATLERYSHRPLIAAEVWRSPELQMSMYRRKVSKVTWGFHCAMRDGKPASLAADIIDADAAWNASAAFWVTLGYAAKAQGLGWGGYWGLPVSLRKGLDAALRGVMGVAPEVSRLKFGWDVAHIETAAVTIAEARAGKR